MNQFWLHPETRQLDIFLFIDSRSRSLEPLIEQGAVLIGSDNMTLIAFWLFSCYFLIAQYILWIWVYFSLFESFWGLFLWTASLVSPFLAPTGSQEVTLSVRPSVPLVTSCLEQSIFIFLGQRALKEHSKSTQKHWYQSHTNQSLKYCVLLWGTCEYLKVSR